MLYTNTVPFYKRDFSHLGIHREPGPKPYGCQGMGVPAGIGPGGPTLEIACPWPLHTPASVQPPPLLPQGLQLTSIISGSSLEYLFLFYLFCGF
jgi:hypothetical protein